FASASLIGFVLVGMRRWRLPLGTCTLVFTLNAVLAGVAVDLLYWYLRPAVGRVAVLRLFAFSVPVVYYLGYFITLMLTSGITWSIHLWLGSIVMAGIIGLTLSYILLPPASPLKYEG